MRFGAGIDTSKPVAEVIAEVQRLADGGFATASISQIFSYDALTLAAVVGSQVPDIELMTAVVPTYPRHPIMLAAQALTVQAATGGRLALGIGLSHQIVIEMMFGYSFERPARHMREYLSALVPLLRREQVSVEGETLKASTFAPLEVDATAPEVLVAALGPTMLRLAGTMADGTVTWMTGPATLESHIIPSIRTAADEAGRPAPRIAAGLPVCVTDDVEAARQRAAKIFAIYGTLPSYQAMLEREGASGPADVAIVGDEDAVRDQIQHLDAIGVTDFAASIYGSAGERERTMALVRSLIA
jgi:5,10-methylenetetrahydromethanopterin reductase